MPSPTGCRHDFRRASPVKGLSLGVHQIPVPVVVAPMAGVTNRAFRRLAREYGPGVYVSEMVTARALLERNSETLRMCAFDDDESPRSLQLYGTDPTTVAAAVRMVIEEDLADHIDLNMGCPVPKVTRKGGGAALPWKIDLFAAIITASVRTAQDASCRADRSEVPVTVKMRMGIDVDHLTYLDAATAAAEAGVAWVALHARTAAQLYGGHADRTAIGTLVTHLRQSNVAVLGNGDIWTAADALTMVADTSCDGVVVGRGCLGRPWLSGQLAAAFSGAPIPADPGLAEVADIMRRHCGYLVDILGAERGPRDFRKHVSWYLKGFSVPHHIRVGLAHVGSETELSTLLRQIDLNQDFPDAAGRNPRGRTSGGRPVSLPQGWLDSRYSDPSERAAVAAGESQFSGG